MSIEAFIVANRFGLGATSDGPQTRDELLQQLERDRAAPQISYDLPDTPQLVRTGIEMLEQRKVDKGTGTQKDDKDEFRDLILTGLAARFRQNLQGSGLTERLVLFWSNHFTVSMKGKPIVGPLASAMERDAIRPHVLGNFEDMLQAVTRHPAMLLYLDNATSIGPDSIAGQRRQVGLNENLGRELLELHTLGAEGGYTQVDVTTMAKILTGWTLDKPRQGGSGDFIFMDRFHEPGPQNLLGRTYGQPGVQQGQAVLHDLSSHPSTANFLATKLVRHFVADNPALDDVTNVALAYQQSGGDLAATTRAVINLPSVWQKPLPKVKTPYEMILAILKSVGATGDHIEFKKIYNSLKLLDHVPFTANSPAGWPDRADDWVSADAVMARVEICHAFAQKLNAFAGDPNILAQNLFSSVVSADTLTSIRRAPSPTDGLTLIFASPEFQRR